MTTHEELAERGWTVVNVDATDEEAMRHQLCGLAARLGVPAATRRGDAVVAMLRPTESSKAKRNSLSAAFSTHSFPCHVDTAHWTVPCRYIVLGCLDPGAGDRSTFLLDTRALPLTDQQRQLLASTPFRVVNGRRSFFSTILRHGRPFVRYDPGCMRATTRDGETALATLAGGRWTKWLHEVRWERGKIVVLDNWRVLHGRGEAKTPDESRTLMRVYVTGGGA